MLFSIIKRETIANITSFKYFLTILIMIVIFTASGFVFVNRYMQEINDFSTNSNKNLSILNERSKNFSSLVNYKQTIYRKPKLTQIFCDGFEKTLPNTIEMDIFSIYNPEVVGGTNFFFSRLTNIDWVFIISLILSFVALILSFDSFSEERERGTLSLVLSNSIPRDKLILGKYISAVLILMIPLVIGLLINLIIVSLFGFTLNGNQWLKIIVFVGISMLYLSIFLLLGILVSSRSAKSSSSIVILLFIWVILVIIVPACGRIISENLVKVPLRWEVDKRINDSFYEKFRNSERYGKNAGNWGGDLNADWINPPARARLFKAITDARNRINEEYFNQIISQVNFGRNNTKISPLVMYQSVSEAIIGSGVSRIRNLYEQLKRYQEILKNFSVEIDKEDTDSWHLFIPGHNRLLSQKPVDYNSIPKFLEKDVTMGDALKIAVWDIGALFFLNILLFIIVHVSFLRCDVRQR